MNAKALIAPATGLLVSTSTAIALEKAAQILMPPGLGAVTGFALRAGVNIANGLISKKIGTYVADNLQVVVATVENTGVDEEPTQEDI